MAKTIATVVFEGITAATPPRKMLESEFSSVQAIVYFKIIFRDKRIMMASYAMQVFIYTEKESTAKGTVIVRTGAEGCREIDAPEERRVYSQPWALLARLCRSRVFMIW